ncbi:MAG: hypothetical protein K0Q49_1267 [Haloplasmataceae bacterium]|jgi:hypothetical protein|nr:hypothetical protein [Haloplasmataceae bacterium]
MAIRSIYMCYVYRSHDALDDSYACAAIFEICKSNSIIIYSLFFSLIIFIIYELSNHFILFLIFYDYRINKINLIT